MKRIACLLLLLSAPVYALSFSDFDPFNPDGELRKGFATLDPFVQSTVKKAKATKEGIMFSIGGEAADYPIIKRKSQEEGWTNSSCRTSSIALVTLIAAVKGAEICTSLLSEPTSSAVCTAFIAASGAAIAEIMCRTLCHRHELKDCPEIPEEETP